MRDMKEKKFDKITFLNGEVMDIELTEATTQELKETGYAMINDPETSETYFILVVGDLEEYYVCKSVDYAGIKLYK